MRSFLSTCDDALGEPDRFLDIAVGQHRQEGALEQFAVLRVGPQRRAVIGGGRGGVALQAGMAGGEIAARRRSMRDEVRARSAPARRASIGAGSSKRTAKRGAGNAPGEDSKQVTWRSP